ncbi:MAG: response regulator [Oscillospiraceae bacterium]|nr:response regulator [Oscillospiraceae bacterium]
MEPIKVFITEDESIVREGLRDMIPWEQYGFTFAGEASDGEIALPLVRKIKPDILITDIKMPFMDGLAFSRLVMKELPNTKIIIISGYDDFSYAQQAIELHVDQYLLKPISKSSMIQALEQTKRRIEEEQDQREYLHRFMRESQGYEQYARRLFFEKLVSGAMRVPEIYEQAAALEIELDAEQYNVVLLNLQSEERTTGYSEQITRLHDAIIQELLRCPDFLVFRCSILTHAIVIKGSAGQLEGLMQRCINTIWDDCQGAAFPLRWYAAVGKPTTRLSGLPQSYAEASHALAFRHFMPHQHVLTADLVLRENENAQSFDAVENGAADPMLIREIIRHGLESEIDDFVSEYFGNLGTACESMMFRHYLILSARINAVAAIQELGIEKELLTMRLPSPEPDAAGDLRGYLTEVLRTAISLRDEENQRQSSGIVENALQVIDQNYADENISLNSVAKAINVSSNYLSAIFSQRTGTSFVEYLTQKRMARARQLLRQSGKRTGEIAAEVGYKDPRYFSFVFKKTQGVTPREYRTGEQEKWT